MKLISWNVNGIRAVHGKKRLLPLLERESPDVLLVQEARTTLEDLPGDLIDVPGYHLQVHAAQRKGYSGVAIYTKEAPDEWFEGLGDAEFDAEGRVLGARFGDVVVASTYFPNSQAAGKRIDYRMRFGAALRAYLDDLRKRGYHVALGGDFNVAHEPIDLARPKQNEGNPGYLPEERGWMDEFLAAGYVDTWRRRHPEVADVYSWWSYRFGARDKNIGWRLDYFCVDEALYPRVASVGILTGDLGSDHCPVTLTLTPTPR